MLASSPHPRFIPGAHFILTPRRLAVVAAALAGLIVLVVWKRDLSAENLQRKVAGVFPVEAAAVVVQRGYDGPLFNDFNWGGFLLQLGRLSDLELATSARRP